MPLHLLSLEFIFPLSSPKIGKILRMPITRSSSRSISSETQKSNSDFNLSGTRKRAKPKGGEEVSDQKLDGLPEIEDFAYGNGPAAKVKLSILSSVDEKTSIIRKVQPPANWEELLEGIKKMRLSDDAPVDSMGCEKAGSFLPPRERSFAVLVSSLLSSQTKDEVTHGAVQRLSQNCLLDAYTIVQTDEASIAKLIYPVHIISR